MSDDTLGRPSVAFRCALALRFLSSQVLGQVLDSILKECRQEGFIDGLCLLGLGGGEDDTPLTTNGLMEFLETWNTAVSPTVEHTPTLHRPTSQRSSQRRQMFALYVSRTGDVQNPALLFGHAAHLLRPPMQLRFYVAQYAALLTRWQLRCHRADLHTLMTARLPSDGSSRNWSPVLYCWYCSNPLTGQMVPPASAGSLDRVSRQCPNPACRRPTPSCAVCLLPIFVSRAPLAEGHDRSLKPVPTSTLELDNWVAWCQACHHGGHIGHLEEWFNVQTVCPVAGCECKCGLY